MTEPKRLLDSTDTPLALRDALRALEPQAPSVEVLERLRTQLGNPAPAAVSGGGVVASGMLSHGLLLGLAVSASLGLQEPAAHPRKAERSVAAARQPLQAANTSANTGQDAPSASTRVRTTLPVRSSSTPRSTSVRPEASTPKPRAHIGPASAPPTSAAILEPTERAARTPQAAPPQPSAAEPSDQRTEPRTQTHDDPDPESRTRSAVAPAPTRDRDTALERSDPARRDARPASAAPLPDPQDEAGLLYRAKRLAVRDPRAALQLLAAHARHFPNGALVEEREVLSIRLQRRIGLTAEADRAAAAFRAQHPRSLYLSGLEP